MNGDTMDDTLTRLNVNLNEKTAADLKSVAEAHGLSATEVVRRSILAYSYLKREQSEGKTLQVRDGDQVSTLVLL